MVEYNKAYKGSTHIGYIKKGAIVHKIYKGSTLVYKLGFDTTTFNPSSSLQTFTVPLGVSKIHVDCVASKGKDASSGSYSATGGKGGRVQCDLAVQGGETLYIMVGDIPTSSAQSYNASDIRIGGNALANRVIVAGGGGAAAVAYVYGYHGQANGGNGGGLIGADGPVSSSQQTTKATGGTQSAGGVGGKYDFYSHFQGGSGELGLGGSAGGSASHYDNGAGGAGYYGGGGSCVGSFASEDGGHGRAAGGGGGSSYTNSDCSNVVHTQGYRNGAGYVTISFVE